MVGMTRKWKADENMSAWFEKRELWQEKESFIPFYFRVREFFNLYPRTRLSRSLEQDNINKSSESLERDLNGTARLLVRLSYDLAFEQALRGALAAERERKESLQPRLWNSKSPVAPRRLCCQIFANQREAETSANENKHWKRRVKGNDVITNVISANQQFESTFFDAEIQILRDIVAHSPSFSRPAARASQRAFTTRPHFLGSIQERIERFRVMFTANGKTWICATWPSFPFSCL